MAEISGFEANGGQGDRVFDDGIERAIGVFRDLENEIGYEKALEALHKAVEQGSAKAKLTLGDMYFGGIGVTKDLKQAFEWYRKAAEQGNAEARRRLEWTYRSTR